jgi:hypothetical protein
LYCMEKEREERVSIKDENIKMRLAGVKSFL